MVFPLRVEVLSTPEQAGVHKSFQVAHSLAPTFSQVGRGVLAQRQTERMRARGVSIELADPDRWPDIVAAFGPRAVRPSSCWCQRMIGQPLDGDRPGALRRQLDDAVVPFGLIAVVDGRPAGWSRVGLRRDIPGVRGNRALQRVLTDDPDAWWITCFTVQTAFRRRGVARSLLSAAVDHARANGASAVEGHPVDVEALTAKKVSGSALFTGTLRTFAAEGFREIGRTYPSRPVMRLEL